MFCFGVLEFPLRYLSVGNRFTKMESKSVHLHTEALRQGEEKASENEGPVQSKHIHSGRSKGTK